MTSPKLSLSTRLLIAVSLVLTAFLGLSAFSLNNAFKNSAQNAQQQRLHNHVITLLTAAELTDEGELIMPERLLEPKFSIPNSGLYAQITTEQEIVWQSLSSVGLMIRVPTQPGPSVEQYSEISLTSGTVLNNLAFGVVWENDAGEQFAYTINVAEDQNMIQAQTAGFQRNLWYWLGGTGMMLLVAQWLILRWSLRPLHRAAADLHAVESGEHPRLSGEYPVELHELTQNINNLLDREQHRRQRYKNSLADLAHSLKTPLAVLRSEMDNSHDLVSLRHSGEEQLDRINALVDYQLQRAGTEGKSNLLAPISLGEIIHKIITSLNKVYQSKQVHCQFEIEQDIFIHADEGDLYELLGNLLENAYKYCQTRVNIVVQRQATLIRIDVEDDGNGLPLQAGQEIIKRGQRFDTQVEGQGLGLAIVSDIIEAYQGDIKLDKSYLGGARFSVQLPNY